MAQVLAIAFIVGFASRARPDQWVLLSDVGVNRLPSRAMTPLETVRNVPEGSPGGISRLGKIGSLAQAYAGGRDHEGSTALFVRADLGDCDKRRRFAGGPGKHGR